MGMDYLLQNPIFVREASILVHTLLLTGLLVSWLRKVLKRDAVDHLKSANLRYYRLVISSSLALFAYNLVFCCLNYLIWSSDERLITLLDLALRSLAWLLVTVYLKWEFNPSTSLNFPVFLRIWWGIYLAVSCYGLVTDLVIECQNHQCLRHFQVLGSDMVYVISGILFCCVGNFVKRTDEDHDHDLQEPLLNEDSNNIEISPYVNAGFFSNVTFSWVGSLISKGKEKALSLDDVPPLSGEDNVGESYLMFRKGFKHEGSRKCREVTSIQIVKSLICMTWGSIVSTFLYSLMYSLAVYVGPYLIDSFVEYLNGMKVSKNEGYVLASAFVVAKLVEGISQMQMEFVQERIGLRTKAVLMESVYTKALALSCQSKDGQTSGQMINYMSVDAERVGDFFSGYLHDPWMVILQIVLGLLILYRTLGLVAAFAALIATVLVMLINFPVSNLFDKYYDKLMESRDRRMKTTTEILKNMRILKLQAWDMKFLSKIMELRNVEYEWLKKSVLSMAMTTSIFWVAPVFVSVVTFGTCLVIAVPLKSGKILSAIATFRILQQAIHFLPGMVSMIIQTKVSVSRIASFLSLDELDPNLVEKLPASGVNNEVAVEITGGNFSWDVSASSPTLKDINLKIESGMRIAICGTVGSGKSTLLSCILGEVPKISGMLRLRGSMAYVPQTPWIQSGTISDNILFGKEMDVEKYNRILEACCLKKDLEILPFGDQTIIGERGINLSGGQKQRVQIARALYQDADIYLLDDPFSAVDAHTGTHLFKECVLGLLQCKTVMYVTHQMEFLPVADLILVMKEGCIQQAGKYDDILNSGTDFMELVAAHEEALSTLDPTETATDDKTISNEETTVEKAPQEEKSDTETDDEANRPKGQLVKEEEMEKGRVGRAVYWKYITTVCKGSLVPLILLSQVLFQALQILSNYWIAWATPVSQDTDAPVDGTTLIVVYVSLAIVSSLFILVRALLLATAGYKTASVLFNRMHFSIFRAPMSFFDANPNSRVLNRVSTDQAAVDMNTPTRVGGFAFSVISLLGVIVVMSLVVWQVYLIFVPIIAISLWYQQYYLPAARELFRLDGVSKAPVIQHFTESIAGAAIIRSYAQETRFCETSERLINGYLKPKFYSSATTHWLNFRLDMLSSLIFSCTLIFLIFIPVGSFSPVVAGLAVTYALNLNSLQSRVITNFAVMENRIISVERILQYTGISSEAPLVVDTNRPDPSWPSRGQVDFQDVQVRYAPQLPLVLQGITCSFQGGKKTGIVGRTGCGKSSLIQALFRIVEPAAGRILIDGADISSIGLHDLRSRLSIIPQDPTMFQGTIRGNLDPLEEYTDEQIWEALDKCQLGEEVRNKEGKLDSTVSENGENWSVGQRQLVCLGRVLLKRSKVLVLDEATASVDTATDNVIQQTLRQHFSDSTVITVAHRITSVINSDEVIVLSQGVVEECDTPSRLLANQSSSFSKLVAEYTTRSTKSRL